MFYALLQFLPFQKKHVNDFTKPCKKRVNNSTECYKKSGNAMFETL